MQNNLFHITTVKKSSLFYSFDTAGYLNLIKIIAEIESLFTNRSHSIRDCNNSQGITIIECLISNSYYRISNTILDNLFRDMNITRVFLSVSNLHFISCRVIYQLIIDTINTECTIDIINF